MALLIGELSRRGVLSPAEDEVLLHWQQSIATSANFEVRRAMGSYYLDLYNQDSTGQVPIDKLPDDDVRHVESRLYDLLNYYNTDLRAQ